MRQTEMHLTEEDRTALKSFRSKGLHLAREVNRAQVGERSDAPVGSNRLEAPSQSSPRPELNGSSHDKMPTTNYLCTMFRN